MNEDLLAQFVYDQYNAFAELELDEDSQECFRDATNLAFQANGLEARFAFDNGELLPE